MKQEFRRSWRNKGPYAFVVALVVSLLFHGLLIVALNWIHPARTPKHKRGPLRVSLRAMPRSQWKNTPASKLPKTKQHKQKKKQQERLVQNQPLPKGQIVDIAKPRNEQRPKKAEFLSEFDSSVKKQTQSRYKAVYERVARRPTPVGVKHKTQRQTKSAAKNPLKELRITDSQTEKKQMQKSGPKLRLELAQTRRHQRLDLKRSEDGVLFEDTKSSPGIEGTSKHTNIEIAAGKQGNDSKDQKPSHKTLSPEDLAVLSVAGGPMADYLKDIETSDETALNTKAFKYATFFNRVKREVARNWHPARVHRKYDPYFKVYGYQDRRTIVYVTLDKQGNVEKVEVIEPSGVDFLDDEAVAAIYRASPFPNPPYGLIGEDDKIHFPFGFYFQISSVKFGPVFR